VRKVMWTLALLALCSTAVAGPINAKDVAPGAKWVAHLDVQGLVGSQFGQYVLGQLREKEQLDSKMQGFVAIFGFDPLKDIGSVTIYGAEYSPTSAVIIIKGKWDKEKLLGLLKQNPSYTEVAYGQHTVVGWTDKAEDPQDDGSRHGAFHGDGTAVISRTEATVKAALDVLDGKAAGTPEVIPATGPGVFLVVAAKDFTLPGNADPKARVLKRISGGTLLAGESNDTAFLNAKLNTRKPEDAQRVRQMLDGALAFVSLATEEVTEAEGQTPFWAPLFAGAQTAGASNSVELKLTVNTQTLIKIAEAAKRAEEAKKAQQNK
jgi:hypothetical protein